MEGKSLDDETDAGNVGLADVAIAIPIAAASSTESAWGAWMTEAWIRWVWRGQTLQVARRRHRKTATGMKPRKSCSHCSCRDIAKDSV